MTRVLITGAAGFLGRKLSRHLAERGFELVLLDAVDDPLVGVVKVALDADPSEWARHFEGIDVVVHLAAASSPDSGWGSVCRNNVDAVLNVFEAAAEADVKRVVFASSNWVMAGSRGKGKPLAAETEPSPVNPYGASKLFGERIARFYSQRRGVSSICLRIGYSPHSKANEPGPHLAWGLWGQRMWISDRDLMQGFVRAIEAPDGVRLGIVNLVSRNEGMDWDLEEAERAIGYVPADRSQPIVNEEIVARERAAIDTMRASEALHKLLMRQRW